MTPAGADIGLLLVSNHEPLSATAEEKLLTEPTVIVPVLSLEPDCGFVTNIVGVAATVKSLTT